MPELANDSVALTVTSPPYWNAIDYDRHAVDSKEWYRTRQYAEGYAEYEEYLDWCQRIFDEVFVKTKPGGFCAVVIGTVLYDKRHLPVPFEFTSRMVRTGWDFHQDIIWHKCTAGVKRAGVVIQKPYPGYYYPNIMTEYILIFRKPGPHMYRDVSEDVRAASRVPIDQMFTREIANNVWHVAPVPPGHLAHPCPFPEEIPHRLTRLYTHVGDIVLDPFVGSGQTTKVAHQLGRVGVGYDIQDKYVELATQRLEQPLSIRQKQLVAVFDKMDIDTPLMASNGRGQRRPKHRPTTDGPDQELLPFELSLEPRT